MNEPNPPIVHERRGAVAVLRLNRPESFHAMDDDLLDALAAEVSAAADDPTVRAVVLTGDERAFSGGGDVRMMASHPDGPAAVVDDLAERLHPSILAIRQMRKPVIAAIERVAAGAGMSLALACDFRVMAKGARMVLAYSSRGLSFDGGGSFALPRLVGLAKALEIVGFDEPITAEEALELGLVTRVADDGKALEEALALAGKLAERSTNAFGEAKRLLLGSFGASLEAQLAEERAALVRCAHHEDGREGVAAFAAKREPVFRR